MAPFLANPTLYQIGVIAFLSAYLLTPPTAQAQQSSAAWTQQGYAYSIGPVGFGSCAVTGINDRGQVIGFAAKTRSPYSHVRAFITGPKGLGITPLSLGGSDSYAWGVNTVGQVVGVSADGTGRFRPFITDADGANIRVLELPGVRQDARGINDQGQVVGGIGFADGSYAAYFTGPGATGVNLLGGYATQALRINASGQIIGNLTLPGDVSTHSFITGSNGVGIVELGLAGGTGNGAEALNDQGQVTGLTNLPDGSYQQYITGPNGKDLKLLGTLKAAPETASYGTGINNLGNTVGASYAAPKANKRYPFPVTVSDSSHLLDLNRLVGNLLKGVTLAGPGGINRYNQISASATDGNCYIVCPNKNCAK